MPCRAIAPPPSCPLLEGASLSSIQSELTSPIVFFIIGLILGFFRQSIGYVLPAPNPPMALLNSLGESPCPRICRAAPEPRPKEETPEEPQNKPEISLWAASLITQNLPSKRLITPITSALHGAALTFIAWLALMMAEALFKKTPDDNHLDRVLYLHGLLLGSMVLGSSAGYVSGLLYQRWGAARPYGLLLRNVLSASAALLLSGVTYKSMENLTLFKKDDRCTYSMKDQCALHLVVAVICFLVCTELIRSRRDHRSLPAQPTKLVTLGRAFLERGAVGMLFFILYAQMWIFIMSTNTEKKGFYCMQ